MSQQHAQLTVRDIHGPYMQLLVNLQGEDSQVWLDALKRFLRKENPWERQSLPPKNNVISVPTELQVLLTLHLSEVFTEERCSEAGYPKPVLTRVCHALGSYLPSKKKCDYVESFNDATLSNLVELCCEDRFYLWKVPALGRVGRNLIIDVLISLGLGVGAY